MDLKFAVSIIGYDQLSGVLGQAADSMSDFGDRVSGFGDKIYETGDRMVEFGEHLSMSMMLVSEGVDKLKEVGDSLLEPAISLDQAIADVAAHTNLAHEGLMQLKEAAVAFSDTHAGVTAEQMLENFLQFNAILPDTKSAMDAAGESAMLAKYAHIDLGAANDLLVTTYANLHEPMGRTGDMLAETTKYFEMGSDATGALARMLPRLSGDANLAGASLSEMMAIAGEASKLMPGSRGQIMFASGITEMLEHAAKAGIDTSHGLMAVLEQERARLEETSGAERAGVMKSLGINNPVILQLLKNLDAVEKANQAISGSNGALAAGYKTATDNAADLATLQKQAKENAEDAAASGALPALKERTKLETDAIRKTGEVMENHAKIGGMLTTALDLTGSTLKGAVGLIQAAMVPYVLFGYGGKAIGRLFGHGAASEVAGTAAEAATEGGAAAVTESVSTAAAAAGTGTAATVAETAGAGLLGAAAWPLTAAAGLIAAHEYLNRHPSAAMAEFNARLANEESPWRALAERMQLVSPSAKPATAMAAAGGGVTINYAPVFNLAAGSEQWLMGVLKQHAYDLKRILEGELAREGRTSLS